MLRRHVPSFIEAKTKDELRRMMFAVKQRHGQVHFFDFSYAEGKWVCWFEVDNVKEAIRQKGGK